MRSPLTRTAQPSWMTSPSNTRAGFSTVAGVADAGACGWAAVAVARHSATAASGRLRVATTTPCSRPRTAPILTLILLGLSSVFLRNALVFLACLGAPGCVSAFGGGMSKELRQSGVPAPAEILEMWDTGWTIND